MINAHMINLEKVCRSEELTQIQVNTSQCQHNQILLMCWHVNLLNIPCSRCYCVRWWWWWCYCKAIEDA